MKEKELLNMAKSYFRDNNIKYMEHSGKTQQECIDFLKSKGFIFEPPLRVVPINFRLLDSYPDDVIEAIGILCGEYGFAHTPNNKES